MQPTLPPPVPAEIQNQLHHKPINDEGIRIQRWTRIIDSLAGQLDPDELGHGESDSHKNPNHSTKFVLVKDDGYIIDRQAILLAALEEIAQLGK